MSETLRELIDSAEASGSWDAVADWCEEFDWAQTEGIPTAEFYLRIAATAAAEAAEEQSEATGAQLREAVAAARNSDVSWEQIGEVLGMTSQDAQQGYETPAKSDKGGMP